VDVFLFDGCELDVDRRELRVGGEARPVEPQVFDVLAVLVRERDRVVTKDELLDAVWRHRFVTESAVSSRIKSARRAIGDDGRAQRLIRTVHGRGYQFVGDVREPGPEADRAPLHVAGRRATPVPPPATATVGRRRDIGEVLGLLDRARIVTLLGPGGVGKTRLGTEAALRWAGSTGRQDCFVDLTKVRDARLVPALIVRELGIHGGEGGDAEHRLAEALRGKSLLLVLDNFEHVVEAAGVVADLVRASPGVQALVTSRARLRIAGEHVYDVAPLAVERDGEAGCDGLPDAVALFDQAATAVDPSFRLADHLTDVATICRTVDGLPLAIELAAGHVRTLPPALLRTRLGAQLRSAAGGARDAPARQRTIPATIDWSLALLGPAERALFTRLGVFSGPVPLEAVEAVCADPAADGDAVVALGRLVDQSLVRRVAGAGGEPRFVLLELLRERAGDLLAEGRDEVAVRRRHAAWCAAFVEDQEDRRWLDAAPTWVEQVAELLSEVRAAHGWAQEHGEIELATRITASLGNWWHREGHMDEGRRWVAEALASADGLAPRLGAMLQLAAGFVFWPVDYLTTRGHLEAAAAAFERLGDDRYLSYTLNLTAGTFIGERERYEWGRQRNDRALELARRVGEGPLVASALNVLGELARVHGDDATARAAYEEGRALAIACGDAQHAAMFDGNLAFIAEHEGRFAAAHRLATESLRQAWALGRRLTGAEGISLLAGPELALGRPERSAMLIGASDEALRVMGVALPQGDRPEHARVVAGAREALGDQAYERLCAEGARLSLDEAIDLALGAMTGEVSPR
jgi:predicted ATPase/DNA-binding winged helix-turn-helix (wHTH) protein